MNILNILRSARKRGKPIYAGSYLQVFSHPRSGTHFLEAFIAENFYPNSDLLIKNIEWGHWANRIINTEGNPYGKLFGGHTYPNPQLKHIDYPVVYIFRDGRAVAYSIWRTRNFLNPRHSGLSLSEFLRTKIDWIGSPAFKCKPKMNIAEHWVKHVDGWIQLADSNPNIFIVRFEELASNPHRVYSKIRDKFFLDLRPHEPEQIFKIEKKVGLFPNQAIIDSWKTQFSKEDNSFFINQTKSKYLYFEGSPYS